METSSVIKVLQKVRSTVLPSIQEFLDKIECATDTDINIIFYYLLHFESCNQFEVSSPLLGLVLSVGCHFTSRIPLVWAGNLNIRLCLHQYVSTKSARDGVDGMALKHVSPLYERGCRGFAVTKNVTGRR